MHHFAKHAQMINIMKWSTRLDIFKPRSTFWIYDTHHLSKPMTTLFKDYISQLSKTRSTIWNGYIQHFSNHKCVNILEKLINICAWNVCWRIICKMLTWDLLAVSLPASDADLAKRWRRSLWKGRPPACSSQPKTTWARRHGSGRGRKLKGEELNWGKE